MKISSTIRLCEGRKKESNQVRNWFFLLTFVCLIASCGNPSQTPVIPSSPVPSEGLATVTAIPVKVNGSDIPFVITETGNAPMSKAGSVTSVVSETEVAKTTSSAIPIDTPFPTISAIIQYGSYSQQIGWSTDRYVGKNTPILALYSNGLLLIRSEKYINGIEWYESVRLDHLQMCWLMARIAQTGIYEMNGDGTLGFEDPIYQFDQETQPTIAVGEIVNILKVSEEKTKWVQFLPNSTRWLAEPLQKVLELLDAYTPPGILQPYVAERVLLWIERGRGSYEYATRQAPSVVGWPQSLPTLVKMLGDQEQGQYLLGGKEATQVQRIFDYRPVGMLFLQKEEEFFVIARPLLPDETVDNLSIIPTPAKDYKPALLCDGK